MLKMSLYGIKTCLPIQAFESQLESITPFLPGACLRMGALRTGSHLLSVLVIPLGQSWLYQLRWAAGLRHMVGPTQYSRQTARIGSLV